MHSVAVESRPIERVRQPSPPFLVVPCIASMVLLAVVDGLLGDGAMDLHFVASMLGLSAGFGAALAAVLGLCLCVVPRLPWVGWLVVPAGALVSGGFLAVHLGVLSRLQGPYRTLALTIGAACMAVSFVAAVLLSGLQQSRSGGPGWLFRRLDGRGRVVLALAITLLAFIATAADHTLYVGLYPVAHLYLRGSSCVWLSLGVSLLVPVGFSRWRSLGVLLVAASLTLLPFIALSGVPAAPTLQAFSRRPLASTLLASIRRGLDFDGDGFSAFLGGGDCDDGDAAVHPAAEEIPDNGRDDNCFGGDARRQLKKRLPSWPQVVGKSSLNIVLITIDTLRWDRLGPNDAAYGVKGQNTMPQLSAWAMAGTNFRRAYSTGSWTSVSLASMHRGRYPRHLRWEPHYETTSYRLVPASQLGQLPPNEKVVHMFPLAWHDPSPTLAQLMVRQQMRTAAVVDDDFTSVLASSLGTSRGFQIYREVQLGAAAHVRSDDARTAELAIAQLESLRHSAQPFFLWVHFFGPHGPSSPHPELPMKADTDTERYDLEVRYADIHLGALLAALQPLRDTTAVFVTSDHGEDLKGSYRAHGTSLEDHLIRVPLVARVPGWPVGTFEGAVSLVDLMPTMLGLAGASPCEGLDGQDLSPWVTGKQVLEDRILISDNWRYESKGRVLMDSSAAYDGQHKLELNRLNHAFLTFIQDYPHDQLDMGASSVSGPLGITLRQYLETAITVVAP